VLDYYKFRSKKEIISTHLILYQISDEKSLVIKKIIEK